MVQPYSISVRSWSCRLFEVCFRTRQVSVWALVCQPVQHCWWSVTVISTTSIRSSIHFDSDRSHNESSTWCYFQFTQKLSLFPVSLSFPCGIVLSSQLYTLIGINFASFWKNLLCLSFHTIIESSIYATPCPRLAEGRGNTDWSLSSPW